MEYQKLISATGLSGLYEMQAQKGDGVIINSIKNKVSKFISSRLYKVTLIKDIEIFTTKENVLLIEVFKVLRDSAEKQPDIKDKDAVKKYFKKVYPDMDFEKVYYSDMKKILLWFNELKESGFDFEIKEELEEEETTKTTDIPAEEEKEKNKKTTSTKKVDTTKKETDKKKGDTAKKTAKPKQVVKKVIPNSKKSG